MEMCIRDRVIPMYGAVVLQIPVSTAVDISVGSTRCLLYTSTREGETVALWTGSICQKVEPGKMAGKKEGEERENPHRSEEESMTFFEREPVSYTHLYL